MSEVLTWGELDQDGALEEATAAVSGDSRADFVRKAAVGGGAVLGSGALLGVLPSIAMGATPRSDVAILNYALTLEFLEAEFYTQAERQGRFQGRAGQFARIVGGHERAHVAFLKNALGRAAVRKPRFNFKGTTTDQAKFLQTARVLEDTGVAAYLGQVGNIKTKAILKAASTIVTVEARHAAWIRDIIGGGNAPSPAPAAFDAPKSKPRILSAVRGTGFIVG